MILICSPKLNLYLIGFKFFLVFPIKGFPDILQIGPTYICRLDFHTSMHTLIIISTDQTVQTEELVVVNIRRINCFKVLLKHSAT